MKSQARGPQPLGLAIGKLATVMLLRFQISKKRTEEKYLKRHPAHHSKNARRIFQLAVFDPGERLLLPAGRRNAERYRRAAPLEDSEDHPSDEDGNSRIGENNPEENARISRFHPHIGN